MKKVLLFFIPFFLTGCGATMMGNSKNSQHQAEMALHKARTDVEELRCDLNSVQAQVLILENKLGNQELALTSFKQELMGAQQSKLDELTQAVTQLEKHYKQMHKQQKDVLSDLQGLAAGSGDMQAALSQYKEKMTEVEHNIAAQSKKIEEISKLKKTVEDLASLAFQLSQDQKGGSQ